MISSSFAMISSSIERSGSTLPFHLASLFSITRISSNLPWVSNQRQLSGMKLEQEQLTPSRKLQKD